MKTKVGLWIDHRKATIVTVTGKGEEMGLILSRVEKRLRRSGDSLLRVPMSLTTFRQHLKRKFARWLTDYTLQNVIFNWFRK